MRIELRFPLMLSEIYKSLLQASSLPFGSDIQINAITTDSRECEPNDLFFAIRGEHEDGEKYIAQALSKGAFAISHNKLSGAIQVEDTSDALLKVASLYKEKTNVSKTIAITGSVGKSTTVRFLNRILSTCLRVHSPIGNFNNHLGVPYTVFNIQENSKVLITELGMNHENEISALSKCVSPDISVITSIGSSHIGNFGSREKIARAKLEILDGMTGGYVLVPYEEELLANLPRALYVARNNSLSDFSLNNAFDSSYTLKSPLGQTAGISFFNTREHLLYDLAFAVSVSKLIGMTDEEIINGVQMITESDLRQRFITLDGYTVFDDSYNASPESIEADIKYLFGAFDTYSAFLGDVLELGNLSESIHEGIGRMVARYRPNNLYLIGKFATSTAKGAIDGGMPESRIFINTNASDPQYSIRQINDNHAPGECILFKASRRLRLDKIADMIIEEEREKNER